MIKTTYKEVSGFEFNNAFNKIVNAPTDGHTAYRIRKIKKELDEARKTIANEYKKDIIEVFAKRDAEGKYDENSFQPQEDKVEDFQKAQEAFGDRELKILRPMLTSHDIRDVKLSAAEQEALSPLLDEAGFERPQGPNIAQLRA